MYLWRLLRITKTRCPFTYISIYLFGFRLDNLGSWLDATSNKECSRINANQYPKEPSNKGFYERSVRWWIAIAANPKTLLFLLSPMSDCAIASLAVS